MSNNNHSVHDTDCTWVLGTKHKKQINSELRITIGYLDDVKECPVCVLQINLPDMTLALPLAGDEAAKIGSVLLEVGHKLNALGEADLRRIHLGDQEYFDWFKPLKVSGKIRFRVARGLRK